MERPTLSDTDLAALGFLAEHRVAIVPQIQALGGRSARATSERLRGLEDERLIARRRIFDGHPAACWITRRGLAVIGSPLPAPQIDLKGYRHDVGVAWLWLAAQDRAFGKLRAQVSERTMRSEDGRRDRASPAPGLTAGEAETRPRHGIGVGESGPGGRPRLHYPDLMLETASGHRVALELELTGKSARRLDRIMLGYAGDPRVDAVLYLCPQGALGQRVQTSARRMGIDRLVHVQCLPHGSPAGVPEPGPQRDPAPARTGRRASQTGVRAGRRLTKPRETER